MPSLIETAVEQDDDLMDGIPRRQHEPKHRGPSKSVSARARLPSTSFQPTAAQPSRTRVSSLYSTPSIDYLPSARPRSSRSQRSMQEGNETGESSPSLTRTKPAARAGIQDHGRSSMAALTFTRIYTGQTQARAMTVLNTFTGKTERIGRIVEMHADERIELEGPPRPVTSWHWWVSKTSRPATRSATLTTRPHSNP